MQKHLRARMQRGMQRSVCSHTGQWNWCQDLQCNWVLGCAQASCRVPE
jgi:hypothetical protein